MKQVPRTGNGRGGSSGLLQTSAADLCSGATPGRHCWLQVVEAVHEADKKATRQLGAFSSETDASQRPCSVNVASDC